MIQKKESHFIRVPDSYVILSGDNVTVSLSPFSTDCKVLYTKTKTKLRFLNNLLFWKILTLLC